MKTQLFLADSAQADPTGKVHALGLGWSVTSSPTPPMALVILLEIDWNEANHRHHITAVLEDSDGNPVMAPGPVGDMPVRFESDFEVGKPPGSVPGTPFVMPITVTIGGGLALIPGQRYRWKVTNSAQLDADLEVGFTVRET